MYTNEWDLDPSFQIGVRPYPYGTAGTSAKVLRYLSTHFDSVTSHPISRAGLHSATFRLCTSGVKESPLFFDS